MVDYVNQGAGVPALECWDTMAARDESRRGLGWLARETFDTLTEARIVIERLQRP